MSAFSGEGFVTFVNSFYKCFPTPSGTVFIRYKFACFRDGKEPGNQNEVVGPFEFSMGIRKEQNGDRERWGN